MAKLEKQTRNRLVGGIALIVFGLIALLAQLTDWEWLGLFILPGLGLIFLAWGILTRQSGLLIPGGILSGLGLGTLLVAGPFGDLSGTAEGGLFMLAFALGWVLIPVVSTIFTSDNHWWALIPAAIMGLIGGGLLLGGVAMNLLELLETIWPVFLILGGLWLILRRSGGKSALD
jgi:hypothetical protein